METIVFVLACSGLCAVLALVALWLAYLDATHFERRRNKARKLRSKERRARLARLVGNYRHA